MKVLFGVRKGNESWQEEVISEHEDRFDAAKKWATENGFDRLRIADIDLTTPPDFTKSVRRRRR